MNKQDLVKVVELDFCRIGLRKDGILYFEATKGPEITIDQLKESLEVFEKLIDGRPRLFLSDNRKYGQLGYPERKFVGDNLHRFAIASAVIEDSAVIRFIGHNINDLFPPKVPMEMFSTKDEAVEWLMSLDAEESVQIDESFDLGFALIELRSDGILTVSHPSLHTVNLAQLKQMVELFVEIVGDEPRLFYADNSNLERLGYPEREFIGENLHRFAKAGAVKENSSVVRFIGHTINHMFPPKVPLKMFKTKKECIDWLKSQ